MKLDISINTIYLLNFVITNPTHLIHPILFKTKSIKTTKKKKKHDINQDHNSLLPLLLPFLLLSLVSHTLNHDDDGGFEDKDPCTRSRKVFF